MNDGFMEVTPPPTPPVQITADQVLHGPSIPPQQRIQLYSADEWEGFVQEWVHFCLKARYVQVQRFSGAGDKGTFRHTYRSWLDETGAPMKVQQELMRHASIQTTMNVYGRAMASSKREANGKIVEMVLKPVAASA